MKMATLYCSAKTKYDTSLHTAGAATHLTVPQKDALRIARKIHDFGDSSREYSGHLKDGECIAAGHGVTIVYASGRRREVPAY